VAHNAAIPASGPDTRPRLSTDSPGDALEPLSSGKEKSFLTASRGGWDTIRGLGTHAVFL